MTRPRDPVRCELVELVDWCCYVVDREPVGVTGLVHRREGDAAAEDYQMLSLHFADGGHPAAGPVAQISCGRYIPARWREAVTFRPLAAMQVSCQNGIAFVDLPSTLVWFDEARPAPGIARKRAAGRRATPTRSSIAPITSLVRRKCDMDDACRASIIVEEARRSFFEGRRIAL